MRRVLLLGATSAISRALAHELCSGGDSLFLAGRDPEELERLAADLTLRHEVPVKTGVLEATDFDSHARFLTQVVSDLKGLDGIVCALGSLGNQPEDSWDSARARTLVDVNLTSAVSLLSLGVEAIRARGNGFVVGLSSVAGDRGRQSNYVYGAAKGGFSLFLDGLRNRLEREGIRVYTVKLGFVDTAMTWGKKGLFLVASPQKVARSLNRMLKRPSGIYYIPSFWRPLMLVIRLIPDRIFKRLSM